MKSMILTFVGGVLITVASIAALLKDADTPKPPPGICMKFEPQPDITAYELAFLLAHVRLDTPIIFRDLAEIEKTPKSVIRHFVACEPQK